MSAATHTFEHLLVDVTKVLERRSTSSPPPCVSETTEEVFNNGGISQVFGKTQILEIVTWEDQSTKKGERSLQIGTLRDALRESAWYREGYKREHPDELDYPPALDIPKLSLSTGLREGARAGSTSPLA